MQAAPLVDVLVGGGACAPANADPADARSPLLPPPLLPQMKARLTALVERVSDEGVMVQGVELNEEAQRMLDRHA